ncbi:uncharacterized protein LOC112464445 [Temnothorax curvispinosus]|uniref:Uncharacterized protein LOC112464445 n=1 Tax=Temnothorax curvispinosus TaxID=300111 RepID=A0A6J1QXY6_9HYME|nr:uncharacterized protein LOC112464445 [Temnothorax curvispinosus]
MSRKALSYVLLLLYALIILNAECTSGIPDRCLELIRFDIHEIENHLSELNLTDVPTVKMMTAGFKCPISALPFGTLKSDWARLLLLQQAQSDGSIIKLKLVRLMQILIIAYYQMEEHIDVRDVTGPGAAGTKAAKKSLVEETTTTVPVADETKTSHYPSCSNFLGAEISSNNANRPCSYMDSFSNDVTRLATKTDCSRIKTNATVIEIATMNNLSSPNRTTTVIPPDADATRQNVTSLIDLGAATTYYPAGNAKKAALLGNCLKLSNSLKDIARRPSGKVFEIVKTNNKAKYYTERAARKGNETDDRRRDRTVIRISPPINEFWRYVTFPTRAPLTTRIASVAPAYRMPRLTINNKWTQNRSAPRKSRKRTKLNNDIYESFRRFYGVDKNKEGTN